MQNIVCRGAWILFFAATCTSWFLVLEASQLGHRRIVCCSIIKAHSARYAMSVDAQWVFKPLEVLDRTPASGSRVEEDKISLMGKTVTVMCGALIAFLSRTLEDHVWHIWWSQRHQWGSFYPLNHHWPSKQAWIRSFTISEISRKLRYEWNRHLTSLVALNVEILKQIRYFILLGNEIQVTLWTNKAIKDSLNDGHARHFMMFWKHFGSVQHLWCTTH